MTDDRSPVLSTAQDWIPFSQMKSFTIPLLAAALAGACHSVSAWQRFSGRVEESSPCTDSVVPTRLALERVLTSAEGLGVIQQGLMGFAPFRDGGVVALVIGPPRSLWIIDSLGKAAMLPVDDSVWTEYPDISGLAATSAGLIVLWEGSMGNALVLRPDGEVESVHELAEPRTGHRLLKPASDDGLYFELSGSGPQRVVHFAWPLGASPPDTLVLPASEEGRKFASVSAGNITINKRVPFYPEPVWAPVSNGSIVWTSGAHHTAIEMKGQAYRTLICDPGNARPKISSAEREQNEALIVWANRYTDSTWTYVGPRVPEVHPAIVEITSDREGRVLLTVPTESRELPASERWSVHPGDPKTPITEFEPRWDIHMYSRDGRPLGIFALPPQVDQGLWTIAGETVWGIRMEPWSGLIELVRYRLHLPE